MSWDTLVSAEAWQDLHHEYDKAGREDADDHTLADILRKKMEEVEG